MERRVAKGKRYVEDSWVDCISRTGDGRLNSVLHRQQVMAEGGIMLLIDKNGKVMSRAE